MNIDKDGSNGSLYLVSNAVDGDSFWRVKTTDATHPFHRRFQMENDYCLRAYEVTSNEYASTVNTSADIALDL